MGGNEAAAIQRLCRDLELPAGDAYTQDWIYELPQAFRRYTDLLKYRDAYTRPGYGDIEKRILMQLMLDITNDFLQSRDSHAEDAWEQVKSLLLLHSSFHQTEIEYWSLPGEPLEDAFAITSRMRSLFT